MARIAQDEVLARLAASPARRAFSLAVLYGLGGIVAWLALSAPVTGGARVLLLVLGVAALALAETQRRASAGAVLLTAAGLFEETGRPIAALDDIASVDRGVFAFKPSNGFVVRLRRPARRGWAPGLWWRAGRRVGVGGVTPGAPGRAMADRLSLLLADRDQQTA